MMGEWKLKEEICEIGRRIYKRQFAAANDGNISVRIGPDRVLCTPTGVSKGFMKPADICTVDMEGGQVSGNRKRTTEALIHLEVYRALDDVKAVVHCHPPHATAFGVAGVQVPTCILPEVEVAIGMIPTAQYETPSTKAFAETLKPFFDHANTIILANHGAVSWGESLELAYFRTEILDSYCRILMLAKDLGNVNRIPDGKVNELLDLRPAYGFPTDPRREFENVDLCANSEFGRGYSGTCACGGDDDRDSGSTPGQSAVAPNEEMVQLITDAVMGELGK
jgi:L-fuculose-phosphate aldolase